MKKRFIAVIATIAVCGVVFASCEKKTETVAVSSVTLDEPTLILAPDATATLSFEILPAEATNKKVTWTSNDTSVATVEDGVVTAIAEGEATITVKTEDGNKTAICVVTVEIPIDPSLSVTPPQLSFEATGGTETVNVTSELAWTVTPSAAWITVEQSETSFTVTVAASPFAVTMTGSVSVSNGVETETKIIEVEQDGTGASPWSTFDGNLDLGEITLGLLASQNNGGDKALCYTTTSYSSGVTAGPRGTYVGTGWVIHGSQFQTPVGSPNIPDGTYIIARSDDPGHVLAGFTPNNGALLIGIWVRKIENNVEIAKAPLVAGTVVSTRTDGVYTMVLNGFDDLGNAITATLTGTGVRAEE